MAFFDPSPTPYRQRVKPVGSLTGPVGDAPGGNPFGRTHTGPMVGPGGLPNIPGIDPTVMQQAWGVLDPQLKNAADIINRRSQMGAGYITGLSNFMQSEMGNLAGMVGDAYGGPIKQARAVANWAGTGLTQSGAGQDASVAQQMATSGPLAKSSDLDLTKQGAGAGGAAYGTGISYLDNLIANKAAAQTRSALEPSFAAMQGQQDQSMLAAQLARQLSDMQGNITAQMPQLLLDLQNRADTKAADQRDYQEKVREFEVGRKQDRLTQL